MKGPSGRSRFDVRRLWRCPRCQHTERLHARIVNRQCPKCSGQAELPGPVWMSLIEEKRAKPREAAPQDAQVQSIAPGEAGA